MTTPKQSREVLVLTLQRGNVEAGGSGHKMYCSNR